MSEVKETKKKKPNLVEIAKKKRHLYLFEKLQSNKPLTPSELKELERLEVTDPFPWVVDSKEKVAKALAVSVRTVYYWEKDGMPVTPHGMYDLLDIKAWRMTKDRRKDLSESEKDKWEVEFLKNKALLTELEYKKAISQYLPRAEVEAKEIRAIQVVKNALLALPHVIAPLLSNKEPREICAELENAIREILDEFAGNYRYRKDEKEMPIKRS